MRDTILLTYRIAGPIFVLVSITIVLEEMGLVSLNERTLPGPLYTLYVMFAFGLVFAIPVLFIYAIYASTKFWGDWTIMLPAAALGLFALSIIWSASAPERYQAAGTYLFGASFLAFGIAATWAGWISR